MMVGQAKLRQDIKTNGERLGAELKAELGTKIEMGQAELMAKMETMGANLAGTQNAEKKIVVGQGSVIAGIRDIPGEQQRWGRLGEKEKSCQ